MEYHISEKYDNISVKDFLRRELKLSQTLLRRLKTLPDGIVLDGRRVTVRAILKAGQTLSLHTEDVDFSPNVEPKEGSLPIVFEDESIIIINKPFGMPVHPSPGHSDDTVANILAFRAQKEGKPRVFRAVNRLDSGTGGLMCVAKNARAAALLSAELNEKAISRTYEAVLCGKLEHDEGTIDLPIGICDGSGIKRQVRVDGQPAVTHYRVLERKEKLTRAEIRLETGRTHQIRVHFSHLGCPVWGDFMYGREEDFRGWALFSKELSLRHPDTGEQMTFSAPLPSLFAELMSE